VTQPPQPPDDSWPTPEDPTVISHPETVVGAPPPTGPPPDRRIGAGMLLGLGAVALVAIGILVGYLLTHRDKNNAVTTTVVATVPSNNQATTSATTTAATTAPTTTGKSTTTTSTTDTSPTTTTPPPPQNATMPDVAGQKEPSAVQAMGKVGILASLFFVPSQDPLGTVVGQAKPGGTSVPFHSHVQINLSKGPNSTATAQVPDVVGQTLTQAVTTVNGAHLRLIYLKFPVTDKTQAGKIVQQSPLGGGQAPQNAQVLVYLGAFRVQ
jgi:hypothetical protein